MLNSDRFLIAFNKIEKYLCKIANEKINGYRSGFSDILSKACNSNSAVRRYALDLKEFTELRNAIVHKTMDEICIAEPNDWAVNKIESIACLLTKPPNVNSILRHKERVLTLDVNDSIEKAVSIMLEKNYSQIPIYANKIFKDLLTTNTVARWLGSCVADEIFSLKETKIDHVLKYKEDYCNHLFLSRNGTLFEVVEKFKELESCGRRLGAILITENGKSDETLLGIVTIWDLPKTYEELIAIVGKIKD